MSFNLSVILRESARRAPDAPAVIYGGRHLTYRELEAQSDLLAKNLVRLGIEPGQTVGLLLPNVPEFVVSYYGILKAGAVALPMNVLNKAPEIAYFLSDSSARAIIVHAEVAEEGAKGAAEAGTSSVYVVGDGEDPEQGRAFTELLTEVPGSAPYAQRDPNDTAVLLYTSGTTGKPKGVQLTHFQLFMNASEHAAVFEMSERTVEIAVMPLFHTLGLSGILNATVRCGGAVVLLRQFDPEQVLRAVERHQATVVHGVPTMWHALLDHYDPAHHDTSSLGLCGSAGAAIPAELLDRIERTFDVIILEGYGLTESGPAATFGRRQARKPYSVGLPLWGVDVAVWDNNGEELPPGPENVGELVIRGHCTMSGYLNKPEATAEAFAGGWLHSGDLGYRDEDGFFFIVDRKKDMIIRGGYNVYPREVEEVLYTHPAVGEVAVVGVPDKRLGEEVKAYLTVRDGQSVTEQEIIDFAKERVAAYKYPRSVQIVPQLPKGPTGKILKRELLDS